MHVFLFNIGCIGRHVATSLSAYVTTMSETFNFKVADAIAVFSQCKCYENKIKGRRNKACKKKNLSCV